ncbi:MAG: hypothetical protein ACTSUE_03385 [Promethearchaeota archaeon]
MTENIVRETRDIDNIDDILSNVSFKSENSMIRESSSILTPDEEFQGHCSNIEAWYENGYNLNLLDSRLAIPVLDSLYKAGDEKARSAYGDIVLRRLSGGSIKILHTFLENDVIKEMPPEWWNRLLNSLPSETKILNFTSILYSEMRHVVPSWALDLMDEKQNGHVMYKDNDGIIQRRFTRKTWLGENEIHYFIVPNVDNPEKIITPPSGKLQNIQMLIVKNPFLSEALDLLEEPLKLEHLRLKNTGLKEIRKEDLQRCLNLRTIIIEDEQNLHSFPDLEFNSKLVHVSIQNVPMLNAITFVAHLSSLKVLIIKNTNISSIIGLDKLNSIEYLALDGNALSNIEVGKDLDCLKWLSLGNDRARYFENDFLPWLRRLERIDFKGEEMRGWDAPTDRCIKLGVNAISYPTQNISDELSKKLVLNGYSFIKGFKNNTWYKTQIKEGRIIEIRNVQSDVSICKIIFPDERAEICIEIPHRLYDQLEIGKKLTIFCYDGYPTEDCFGFRTRLKKIYSVIKLH